jgi:hypothetical protein
MQGTTSERSKPVQETGTRPGNPEGGYQGDAEQAGLSRPRIAGEAARSAAAAAHRAAAAQRRLGSGTHAWHVACPWGVVERRGRGPRRGEKSTGKTACCFSARKRLLGRVSRSIYGAGVYNQYTAKHNYCLSGSDWTQGRSNSRVGPQGPGVTGTVESGRPPTGGPVRSDRKESRSS